MGKFSLELIISSQECVVRKLTSSVEFVSCGEGESE